MLITTISRLRCPVLNETPQGLAPCGGKPAQDSNASTAKSAPAEITSGTLQCLECSALFPILCGVAIVVPDVRDYILSHAKGIARAVSNDEIPDVIRPEYEDVLAELAESEGEHIEDDLEAERVNALYVVNH